jgi:hypothetical protein
MVVVSESFNYFSLVIMNNFSRVIINFVYNECYFLYFVSLFGTNSLTLHIAYDYRLREKRL